MDEDYFNDMAEFDDFYVDPYEYDADEEYQRDLALGVLD